MLEWETGGTIAAAVEWVMAFFVILQGGGHVVPDGLPPPGSPPAPAPARSGLDVLIDKSRVDLKEHRLEVRMNHVASKVTLKVYDDSNAVIADEEHDFAGRAPGSILVVTWSPSNDAAVARIELFAYDDDGAYNS